MEIVKQPLYYAVFCVTKFRSFADAKEKEGETIAAHIARSRELHEKGTLLLSGAFIDTSDEPLTTMGILTSREAAEAYMKGDPFVQKGLVEKWYIREWANMFA
jgi:uncharacterized protein YciI